MTKELLQQALNEAKADAIEVFTYEDGIAQSARDAIEYMHSWLGVYFEKQALAQQAHFEEQPDGTVIPVDPSEKAQQEQPAQEASATWTEMVAVNLVREGVNKHRARELAAHFLTLPTQPALTYSDLEACREVAGKTFRHHKSSVKGQQVCEADDYEWHLAKAIEAHCRGGA